MTPTPSLPPIEERTVTYRTPKQRTVLDIACPTACYKEAGFHPEKDKKIQDTEQKYHESHARVIACNKDNALRAYEAYCKKAAEGRIEDALLGHKTQEQFLKEYADLEVKEMHRHLELCRKEIYPVIIPYAEEAIRVCLEAAKKDEDWARQACKRVAVEYVHERDEPYSSLALKMKARNLEAIIGALKGGQYGQGGPFSILQLPTK
jgi:hypothetical protein